MLLTLFKEVLVNDSDLNIDLLAIIANNIYDKDSFHKDILYKYLEHLNLKEDNIDYIKSQKFNIRTYSEEYFINKLSMNYKKYLYLILNYFLQTSNKKYGQSYLEKVLDKIEFQEELKDFFRKGIEKIISNKITYKELEELKRNLLYKGSILIPNVQNKKNTFDSLIEKLAFSSGNNQYGIICENITKKRVINIFVNGFGNDNLIKRDFKKWINHKDFFCNEDIYFFNWASGKDFIGHLEELLSNKDFKLYKFIPNLINKKISIAMIPIQILSEWKNSKKNSEIYSYELFNFIKEEIEKNKDVKINLYGHSLGANLIKSVLLNLSIYDIKINNVYLLAGATKNCHYEWESISNICSNIYNFYSYNDDILRFLYKPIEREEPIGLNYIQNICYSNDKIINFDVTNIVNGHSEYFDKLPYILSKTIFRNM